MVDLIEVARQCQTMPQKMAATGRNDCGSAGGGELYGLTAGHEAVKLYMYGGQRRAEDLPMAVQSGIGAMGIKIF